MKMPKFATTFIYTDGSYATYLFKTEDGAIKCLRENFAEMTSGLDNPVGTYIAPDGKLAHIIKDLHGNASDIIVSQIYVSPDYENERPMMSLRDAIDYQDMAKDHQDKIDSIIQSAADEFMLTEKDARAIVLAEKGWTTLLSTLPFRGA